MTNIGDEHRTHDERHRSRHTRARIHTTDGDRTGPVIMTGTSHRTRRTMPSHGPGTARTGAPMHARAVTRPGDPVTGVAAHTQHE